jgi:hypothetical protein
MGIPQAPREEVLGLPIDRRTGPVTLPPYTNSAGIVDIKPFGQGNRVPLDGGNDYMP